MPLKVLHKEIPHYSQFPSAHSVVVERVKDEEGNITGYRAYSKNIPGLDAAEAPTQYDAIQGFHRRVMVYQQTHENLDEANKADVSATSKDPRVRV